MGAHGGEHGARDVAVVAGVEDASAVRKRLLAVELRLFGGRREVHVALLRDVEGVPVRAAQACAGKIEFGMAQRADKVAGAIVETCESCGIHAAIVAAAGVTGSALTRRWRCVRGRG